jgi:DTW domain-containing protein
MNSYHQLRQTCLANATREFNARGKSVVRCQHCQLAIKACICNWRPEAQISCEFVLLMHREELFKPTNTGRLIADIFPAQTRAFCWSRTEPDAELLVLLNDPRRINLMVFPEDTSGDSTPTAVTLEESFAQLHQDKIITFILLDGTWKQSGRMFHLSRWLDNIPCVSLPDVATKSYAVRKSHLDNYLSTAEAAALCLDLVDESLLADLLRDYFNLFNQHYLATRGGYAPETTEVHQRLSAFIAAGAIITASRQDNVSQ